MTPYEEMEQIIQSEVFATLGEDDGLGANIFNSVRNWMDRNGYILYQP